MALTLHYDRHPARGRSELTRPLIILHGLFGFSGNWRSLGRALSTNSEVICVDLRNHGQSPWSDQMSYIDMADDVAHLIESLDIAPPILLGHSMGGKVAMQLVLQGTVDIQSAIVADIAPISYQHSHEPLILAMRSVDFEYVKSRSEVETVLSRSVQDAGLLGFLMQNVIRSETGYRWRINLDSIEENMSHLLGFPSIEATSAMPTLFIRGALSDYIQPDHEKMLKEIFTASRLETIDEAGHWLHAEQPKRFLEIVRRFIDETSDR